MESASIRNAECGRGGQLAHGLQWLEFVFVIEGILVRVIPYAASPSALLCPRAGGRTRRVQLDGALAQELDELGAPRREEAPDAAA